MNLQCTNDLGFEFSAGHRSLHRFPNLVEIHPLILIFPPSTQAWKGTKAKEAENEHKIRQFPGH